jgi:hypothetical protein
MARTTKIIEAPRLNDLVVNGVTTKGLTSLVNDYLATLVNPTVKAWSLDVKLEEKRMAPQWLFQVTTDSGGAALANPFTLTVLQNTNATDLATAIDALAAAALPAEWLAGPRLIKLDSDEQGFAKQFVAGFVRNALDAASANYVLIA